MLEFNLNVHIEDDLKYIPFDKYKKNVIDLTKSDDTVLQEWRKREKNRQNLISDVLKMREKIQRSGFKHRNNSYVMLGMPLLSLFRLRRHEKY